jgi:hypothetical protein
MEGLSVIRTCASINPLIPRYVAPKEMMPPLHTSKLSDRMLILEFLGTPTPYPFSHLGHQVLTDVRLGGRNR